MKDNQRKANSRLTGFYIALCCCVLAIGVAGYFMQDNVKLDDQTQNVASNEAQFSESVTENTGRALENQIEENTAAVNETVEYEEPESVTEAPAAETAQTNTEDTVEEYAVDNPDTEASVTVNSDPPQFKLPLEGEVLAPYNEKLVYSEAMGDWRTHNGIDLKAPIGCSVCAAAKGVVEEVSEDVMGKYVVLSHAGNVTTKYMCLDSYEGPEVGKEVDAGEVIGVVGSAKGEDIKDPHLHFESMRDGKYIDPMTLLPQ